jgi:hypothetical protein
LPVIDSNGRARGSDRQRTISAHHQPALGEGGAMADPNADLKVEFDLLDAAKKTLTTLTSEFQNIKAQESGYDGAMGSADIAGALGSFSGNWDYHRNKLVGSMQALGQLIDESEKQFRQTDDQLAKNLKSKTEQK